MSSLQNRLALMAKSVHTALYRRSKGRRFNKVRGMPVALVTVAGRKTGTPHTTPVAYVEADGGWVVAGSNGGAKAEPQWFRNLRAADRATVEIGDAEHEVKVRVVEGTERDELWRKFVERGKFWQGYTEKSGRVIPLALLSAI